LVQQTEAGDIEQLWKDYYQLYIKFCGIADEFQVINHRWRFLRTYTWSLAPEPYILQATKELVDRAKKLFAAVGCDRKLLESKDQFIAKASSIGLDLALLNLTTIRYLYEELSSLLGHLKQSFYQRTVSLEVPFTITGVSESPERTMGNELMLLAADKLAERYLSCIRFAFPWKWDGVISFLYPHLTTFGGFTRWYHSVNTFHISLTEDGKYFIGDYLTLAHEVAHTIMYSPPKTSKPPKWLSITQKEMYPIIVKYLHQLKEIFYNSLCMGCDIFKNINYFIRHEWQRYVIESLADLFATKIGGVTSLQHLTDFVLDSETFSRLAFAYGFDSNHNEIAKELNNAKQRLCNIYKYECAKECVKLLSDYGESLGRRFATINVELPKIVGDNYQNILQLPTIKSDNNLPESHSILSHLVKEELLEDDAEEEEIKSRLLNFESCTTFDPRKILNVYYKIYRTNGNPPNYAVTLHSLAFNEFQKREKDRNDY
jgi:hypothetical protein